MGFIPSTYSCPTDFTDFHRFRHLASFFLLICVICVIRGLYSFHLFLSHRFHRFRLLACFCPTYLCNLCHLWALLPPIILVPKIHSFHRFRLHATPGLVIWVISFPSHAPSAQLHAPFSPFPHIFLCCQQYQRVFLACLQGCHTPRTTRRSPLRYSPWHTMSR